MSGSGSAKRAYGSGSLTTVTLSNGGRVYVGKFRDVNGRQVKRRLGPVRTPSKPDGMTKTQAEARLRDLISTETARPVAQARTLRATVDPWLEHLEATGKKRSSIRAYRSALEKWFLPSFGDRSLDRITARDVEDVMRAMRAAGLADKSIRNYLVALSALYNYARDKRRQWTRRNPVDDVDLPRSPVYAEIRFLTVDQFWALVDNVPDGPYAPLDRALYLTAGMTGMRIGEVQALQWRNVDFVHGRIHVRRSWDRKEKAFTAPKSVKSERSIPLDDEVAGELERMFRQYRPDAREPRPDDLVFADPFTGEPASWRGLYGRLRDALAAAQLDLDLGFHTLRHTYGTLMAAQGVPMRTLKEWMGHKDIATTMRYAHYSPNPHERALVSAAFDRGTNSGTNLPEPVRT